MYIPRPIKLLFQHNDGWNHFLEKYSDSISEWIKLSVERMLACGTCAIGVRRYCCSSADCTHCRFFCQSCKSKACRACEFKATEQWIAEQQHILPNCDWQHITFTMPHLLWTFFNHNRRYSTNFSVVQHGLCCVFLVKWVSKSVSFALSIPMADS